MYCPRSRSTRFEQENTDGVVFQVAKVVPACLLLVIRRPGCSSGKALVWRYEFMKRGGKDLVPVDVHHTWIHYIEKKKKTFQYRTRRAAYLRGMELGWEATLEQVYNSTDGFAIFDNLAWRDVAGHGREDKDRHRDVHETSH